MRFKYPRAQAKNTDSSDNIWRLRCIREDSFGMIRMTGLTSFSFCPAMLQSGGLRLRLIKLS